MSNIYYDPDELDLEHVGSLDEDGLSYEYNTFLAVRHKPTGRLFYAQDSGCSCPTPFEDERFLGPDDTSLSEIKDGDSFLSFQRDCESFPVPNEEREALISKVKGSLYK